MTTTLKPSHFTNTYGSDIILDSPFQPVNVKLCLCLHLQTESKRGLEVEDATRETTVNINKWMYFSASFVWSGHSKEILPS